MPLPRPSAGAARQRRLGSPPYGNGLWLTAAALGGAACSLLVDVDDCEFPDRAVNSGGTGGGGGNAGVSQGGGPSGGGNGGNGGTVDGRGGNAGAPVNPDAPVAVFDTYSFDRGAAYVVADNVGVLANDTGSPRTAVANVAIATERGGSVALGALGGFTCTPSAPAFWGDDSFAYTVENPDGQSSGRVRLSVQPGTVSIGDVVSGAGNGQLGIPNRFAESDLP